MKEGKRQNQGEKKPVFLRRARRGAFRCDYKSWATPGVSRRRGLLSKTDHRTEKAERARNSSQCQEIKVSLYIHLYSSYGSPLPSFFFIRFLSSSSDVYVVPVQGEKKKERKKKREKEITLPINANTEWGATYAPVK